MKKQLHSLKLALNKKTIANLSRQELKKLRAAGDPTDIGKTCYTETCCCPTEEQCETTYETQ